MGIAEALGVLKDSGKRGPTLDLNPNFFVINYSTKMKVQRNYTSD